MELAARGAILTLSAQPYTWQEALSYMLSLRSSFYFLLISRKNKARRLNEPGQWHGLVPAASHISAFILGFVAVFRRETFASVKLSDSPLTLALFIILSPAAIGGFVVVGKMIMESGTCGLGQSAGS